MKIPGPHSLILISFLMIFILEHCFCTNWARFRFYPTKIPPFEPQFHAEFENESPRAWFLCFKVVFCCFYINKHGWNIVFSPTGHGLSFIRRKYHHSNGNFTLNLKMKVPGPDFFVLTSFLMIFIKKKKQKTAGWPSRPARPAWPPGPAWPGWLGSSSLSSSSGVFRNLISPYFTLFHLISPYFSHASIP